MELDTPPDLYNHSQSLRRQFQGTSSRYPLLQKGARLAPECQGRPLRSTVVSSSTITRSRLHIAVSDSTTATRAAGSHKHGLVQSTTHLVPVPYSGLDLWGVAPLHLVGGSTATISSTSTAPEFGFCPSSTSFALHLPFVCIACLLALTRSLNLNTRYTTSVTMKLFALALSAVVGLAAAQLELLSEVPQCAVCCSRMLNNSMFRCTDTRL